jgi:hypothetical protein
VFSFNIAEHQNYRDFIQALPPSFGACAVHPPGKGGWGGGGWFLSDLLGQESRNLAGVWQSHLYKVLQYKFVYSATLPIEFKVIFQL